MISSIVQSQPADSLHPTPATAEPRAGLAYRPDIEGLRAIAVIIVVACHAGVPAFGGGFTGVDIFFVLSGYLISGLLLKEIDATGKIAFLDFYARRLKRLLPALLLMIVTTMGAAAVILAPFEQAGQAVTATATAFWLSNLYFGFADLDYFSPDAGSNLFLHTWSLGVEEQFYLVWPVFVLFLAASVGRKRAVDSQRLFDGFCCALIACLILGVALSFVQPLWGFYLMPARGWQFALGGLVFVLVKKREEEEQAKAADFSRLPVLAWPLAGLVGLALIVAAVLYLEEGMTYPGFWALIPSTGAALLLFAGTGPTGIVKRFLSLKPMQAIGKVSYSWYLWHWPVLVLGGTLIPQAGLMQRAMLALLALILAWLSLVTVEQPLRKSTFLARRPVFTGLASLLMMTGAFFAASSWRDKSLDWASLPDQIVYQEVRGSLPVIYGMGCDDWISSSRLQVCSFGDADAAKTAVLLGDSVAAQWFPALARPLVQQGWRFLVLTKSACPIVDEPIFYARIGMEYTICSDWRRNALRALAASQSDIIFMGSASSYDYSERQWLEGTQRILHQLSPAAGQVYVIQGTHRLPFDGPACLARRDWQPAFLARLNDCGAAAANAVDGMVLTALQSAASSFQNVKVLDLNPLVCPDNRCSARQGNQIVYRDFQHIATRFVEAVSPRITERIEELREH